jgi:uncharacterized protein (TIGR03435 family)
MAMNLKIGGVIIVVAIVVARSQNIASRLEFEVAAVKANKTNERLDYGIRGDRMYGSMPAVGWIQIAYGVKEFQIKGPAWISTERFDIEAKAANGSGTGTQMRLMLQSLLADRFGLKLHSEFKESPVYTLLVGRSGVKMRPSADQTLWAGDFPDGSPDGQPLTAGGPTDLAPGRFLGEAIPITMFVNLLAGPLGRPVINKTGLTGRYDIDLRYAPGSGQVTSNDPDQSAQAGATSPSLFTAIQEQLGLRLESTKGPVEVLVIDHIERPSEN